VPKRGGENAAPRHQKITTNRIDSPDFIESKPSLMRASGS
jgi:hypothetical protein